ncbi:MAG: hypothetical protein M1834_003628 [Cirrosporium novae-zelandiae]|nr:MAG: hypothetical protein M1834_003628 [Cirrosporium novae-zelandiae]
MDDHQTKLLEGISELFNSTQHSDLIIYIGKKELPAHALILAAQSEFFEKALKPGFKEEETKVFRFETGSEHAYWRVFNYLYTGDYSDEPCQDLEVDDDIELLKHVRVYELADFFFIDNLKELVRQKFESKLQTCWVSETLVDCISELYSTTPYGKDNAIKRVVLSMVYKNINELWSKRAFKDLVRSNGDFAADLINKVIRLR